MRPAVLFRWKITRALPIQLPRRVLTGHRRVCGVGYAKRREDRFPFDKPIHDEVFEKSLLFRFETLLNIKMVCRSEGLHFSLFTPFKNLPPDGRVLTEKEEKCDPVLQRCQTPTYVYETPCPMCKSTGMIESKSKGKRRMHTCLSCHGLGFVRRVTARFVPEISENGAGPNLTLRPELSNGHYFKSSSSKKKRS